MRYSFICIVSILFFISCTPSEQHEVSGDANTFAEKDTAGMTEGNLNQTYHGRIQDNEVMLSVLVEHSAIMYERADTTSEIVHELSYHNQCWVSLADILDMKSIVRCRYDSITGYIRRKELFKMIASVDPDKKYLIWISSDDSVKIIRVNIQKRLIEDELNIENRGVYITPSLVDADAWKEDAVVIQVEMNPAACDATSNVYIIDYNGKLNHLITTSTYGDEGGSFYSQLLFKKGLFLQVEKIDEWEEDENEKTSRRHQQIETKQYRWNGDSLIRVSVKK